MTDQRSGTDRRLATEKQNALSGGDVNYYLTELFNKTVVETEDVIELLKMEFAPATTFKSTCRLCKLRMDLGKPGSTAMYEVDKIVYYNKRTAAVSKRRINQIGFFGKIVRTIRDLFYPEEFSDINNITLDVKDPKRLEPYSFLIGDFINALNPSLQERWILENTFRMALMRLVRGPAKKSELALAHTGVLQAIRLKDLLVTGISY